MYLEDQDVIKAIDFLKSSEDYTVSKLAEHLGLSRSVLYNRFRHLLSDPKKDTEDKLKLAISTLRARTGANKLTISAVAKEAGITRQSISRDYKHLIPFIKGNANLGTISNSNIELEVVIRELKQELDSLEVDAKNREEEFKLKLYSDLMKQDLFAFEANQDKASAIKLQGQVDELTRLHREQMNELSELRAKISSYESNSDSMSSNLEILAHLKADYNYLNSSMEVSAMMKEFFSAENKNIKEAIDICLASQPDAIIFFQPFLTGSFDSLGHILPEKRVVIIESNFPRTKHFQELISNIDSIPIHSFSANNTKQRIAFFNCRANYHGKFNEAFIEKLFELIDYPKLNDGFKSVTTYEPDLFISMVKK
ncbi:AraC family transcriptional regulator [Vibrio sp. Makdt]|uniref:AraC family transcriptional regulator n=1 Tax=Vibrio sp. Makdt TaxID=2998828 RepID=UPI0022CD6496|nr:AraC family transcriptional regulator [Vibrio sp. Makdt]MDA0151586.1 AraC family transcriptional regulator [Vibrio sp. Makdt]